MRALFALLVAASSIRVAAAQQVDTTLWTRLHYRFVGPEGNRAIAVVGEPGNSLVAYVGAASDGIWKTEDGGVHWRAVFDSEPAQAIGALAIAPSAHNVVWAGTGETFFIRSMTALGNGAYRSTDGGRSWQHMGLDSTGRIPHCDRSHESRHRAGLRAGPRLRAPAAARRLSHRGRRSHLDPRPVCGSEHRMLRPRHRSRRSQYAVRRDVAVRGEDMAPAERRAGERAVGVARRRPHVEAPSWSRAARREARRRQSRRGGRALEPEHGVRARRGPRPDALPQRRPRHLLARRVAQPRHGRARAVLRALRRRARR